MNDQINQTTASRHILWYRRSAANWNEALPIGNGRIGAMVFGGVHHERLALNEDTLWSGLTGFYDQPDALKAWEKARKLAAKEQYAEAQKLLEKDFTSRPTEMYLPLGDLMIDFPGSEGNSYRRELDLRTGVSKVCYLQQGIVYERECFVSCPDQVLAVRIRASKPGSISCHIRLETKLKGSISGDISQKEEIGGLILDGVCPTTKIERGQGQDEVLLDYEDEPAKQGIHFRAAMAVCPQGGRINKMHDGSQDMFEVEKANEVIIYLAVRTSFAGWNKHPVREGKEYKDSCMADLQHAVSLGWDGLVKRHIEDHRSLYDRCELTLPAGKISDLPTDERLIRHEEGSEDQALYALLFHYGRYLTIAASRPGTQAMNLQGIWNDHLKAPWHSNYTININTEMNYWPTLPTGLPECAEPMIRLIRELDESGRRSAKAFYDAPGFCAHHNTDLWRLSGPVGNGQDGSGLWALWPLSGGWLCRHLFEYYRFTKDPEFLKDTLLPVLRDAASFYISQLRENENGKLVLSPSTSPENQFVHNPDGQGEEKAALCEWTAMSQEIVRDVLEMLSEVEEATSDLSSKIREVLPRLQEPMIGDDGRILEWNGDFQEVEVHHRHVSHLYGLYPGSQFRVSSPAREGRPEFSALAEAAKKSLLVRGDEGTGWSLAWKVCLWAKMRDGNHAEKLIDMQLRMSDPNILWHGRGGSYPNLLCAHPPFQIDGNFGVCAGIALMLLQEENGEPVYLPALPKAWQEGSVRGLCLGDGRRADFSWKDGQLKESMIR